jgi:prepilin-type N-terminal cleavage/methylation domain-containing protein
LESRRSVDDQYLAWRGKGQTRMKGQPGPRGFTLIEILVVVLIIAVLVAVLLPALARTRQRARQVHCQTNVRNLTHAFITYSIEDRDRLPGNSLDPEADWLGVANQRGPHSGRKPEDGTIFKRQMGSQRQSYLCPADNVAGTTRAYSYSAAIPLTGARIDLLGSGIHYRQESDPLDSRNFNEKDHRANLRWLPGVPIIVEEDVNYGLGTGSDGAWAYLDGVTDRHMPSRGRGWGNLGYVNGSVAAVDLPPINARTSPGKYFHASALCVRYGNRWFQFHCATYGLIDRSPPAEQSGVMH